MSDRRRSLLGVIAAMAVVNLVFGMSFPLLALVLDGQGISKTLIGLNTMVQAAAVVAIAPLAPRLMERIAPSLLMQWAAAILTVLFVIAGLFPNVWFWFPLRFVMGGLTAMLWICSEALINSLAEEHWRGRIIGLYSSVGAAGFALGPLLLIFTGSDGMAPFYATALMIGLAALPLFAVRHGALERHEEETTGLWRIFLLAPTIMLANIVYAAAAESVLTFFPLFGMHLGLSESVSLYLITLFGLGTMILVVPLGWLADRVSRMGMLAVCTAITLVGMLFMPFLVTIPVVAETYAFVLGGFEGMIYALGVMLVGQRFKGAMLAAATTLFTACWGLGTVLGPMTVGIGMDVFGDRSMPWVIAVIYVFFLPWPVVSYWRQRQARRHAADTDSE